jgi:hypothetical protein
MALLSLLQVTATPIEEGDAGVIIKKDGSFQVFNTHMDLDPKNLTEMQIQQGRMILGLTIALKVPEIMEKLIELALDESANGVTELGQRH